MANTPNEVMITIELDGAIGKAFGKAHQRRIGGAIISAGIYVEDQQ